MRRLPCSASIVAAAWLTAGSPAQDWTTAGFDAQRSFWLRADSKISPDSVSEPGFEHLWKMNLGARAGPGAVQPGPVLLDFLISHRGFRSLAFLSGADGTVFAFDTDLARQEWKRPFGSAATPDGCEGRSVAAVARPTVAAFPSMLAVGGLGPARRSPGVGAVGEPGAGAVTLDRPRRPPFRMPEPVQPGARERPPPRPSLFGLSAVHALTPAGSLHTLLASNGTDHSEPIPFASPGAAAHGLMVVDGVAYASVSSRCGGVVDAVRAVDLASRRATAWESGGDPLSGTAGPSMAPDGTLYVATAGGRVVALEAKSLREKASVRVAGRRFASSPVVVDVDGRDYLAVLADDGSVVVLDASDLPGGPVAATAGYRAGPRFSAGSMAVWRDPQGATWILAPVAADLDPKDGLAPSGSVARGAAAAWRFVERDGSPEPSGGWLSRDLEGPRHPIVVAGVAFVAAGGHKEPAALLAFDALTGRRLWRSGSELGSAPVAGVSAGGNEVFVVTRDGMLHAFGFPIEH